MSFFSFLLYATQASWDFHDLQLEVEFNIRDKIADELGHERFLSLSCIDTESVYVEYMRMMLKADALSDHMFWRDVPEWRCQKGGHPYGCSEGGLWCN